MPQLHAPISGLAVNVHVVHPAGIRELTIQATSAFSWLPQIVVCLVAFIDYFMVAVCRCLVCGLFGPAIKLVCHMSEWVIERWDLSDDVNGNNRVTYNAV